ncbi:glycoside hydrolase family 65 protein [Georgenia sp. SYP-B2076]|uniref:glycoside hydrolase family 65 protein n=1 Tax=Georgenia sp. SYP-B2076 TaxID=2495881 RepID=UPI000F8CF721|nr:glycoside hydrolase family 65 protein [Georgenia sp. SYP-B2076]
MSDSRVLPVEPWCLREPELDLDLLGQTESLFALSNGHLGLRGNLDEGEPNSTPGTYLSSFFERHPLPYPEGGYGYPESGQTMVNVTNGKLIRLLVDDEPFDVRYGRLLSHERVLDFRAGTLYREAEWVSPAGRRVRIRSTRLVSFAQRAIAAIAYEVEAIDSETRVILQSELVANEAPPEMHSDDPRVAAALDAPLEAVAQDVEQHGAVLVHRTRRSRLQIAAGMDHDIESPVQYDVENEARDDWARTTVVSVLRPGQTLRLVKYVGYGWSATRSDSALRDQVAAALTSARYAGWDMLAMAQRRYLDAFWASADVEVDGDPVAQQAVRFGLFHVLQAGARTERRAIGAKGLTGTGYGGHTFWDIEGFVLPVLTLTAPEAAADALRWRASTLDLARQRAGTLGLAGAAFPWRTIGGEETSAYWPAGTAALHVNADIARALEEYRLITGDEELETECGLEVLVETARLWRSIGHHDRHGQWHVDGVTGPDEYTAVVDDNVFTNLMAARNLRAAAEACARHPREAGDLGVTTEETATWRNAADAVYVPYDAELGVHPQCENFTRFAEWDFRDDSFYPLMMSAPYFQLYRKQVVKQADLVLAMHWCPEAFTAEQKARNLDYYERRTVRDSSLSACTQAVLCAETGHLRLAHDYLHEAALVDLRDLHHNTSQGLHIASLAGTWTALVEGFGGLRAGGERVCLAPALPDAITRMAFRVRWRGMLLLVEMTGEEVRCSLPDQVDAALPVRLYDEELMVTSAEPVSRPCRRRDPLLPPPTQPPGLGPRARFAAAEV